jgi:L-lactate dehydrogenase complex protein LldF
MLNGPASVKDLAHASSLCGACADACPVLIDIQRMLIELPHRGVVSRTTKAPEVSDLPSFDW